MIISLTLRPRSIIKWLIMIALGLVLLGWAGTLVIYSTPYTTLRGTIPLFALGNEANVPTAFSALLHLLAALSLLLLGRAKRAAGDRFALTWKAFGGVFLCLALDELAQIHEWSANVVRPLVVHLKLDDVFSYAWLLPGVLFVAGCAVAFARLFFSLSSNVRWRLIASAALFLGGAVVLEFIESYHDKAFGHDFAYAVMVNIEEGLEMAGVILFIQTVLGLLDAQLARPAITPEFVAVED